MDLLYNESLSRFNPELAEKYRFDPFDVTTAGEGSGSAAAPGLSPVFDR